jgi:hypothetical protein
VARVDYRDQEENTAWQFKVRLVEPLIQQDQEAYDHAGDLVETILSLGSIELLEEILKSAGAFGTSDGAKGTLPSEVAARLEQVMARMERSGGANGTASGADGTERGRVWNALSSLNYLKNPLLNLLNHLKESRETLSTTTTTASEETTGSAQIQALVLVENIPDTWHLPTLLSSTQLHPGTRKKLLERGIESWVLVSHLLYAHSRDAGEVQNPMALVGSALISDPQNGFGGYYNVLAKRPPQELAEMISRAHDFALRYPYDYSQNWQSGNQAWDLCMSRTRPERLQQLACRLGLVRMG